MLGVNYQALFNQLLYFDFVPMINQLAAVTQLPQFTQFVMSDNSLQLPSLENNTAAHWSNTIQVASCNLSGLMQFKWINEFK